jgi:hypothetical protein
MNHAAGAFTAPMASTTSAEATFAIVTVRPQPLPCHVYLCILSAQRRAWLVVARRLLLGMGLHSVFGGRTLRGHAQSSTDGFE